MTEPKDSSPSHAETPALAMPAGAPAAVSTSRWRTFDLVGVAFVMALAIPGLAFLAGTRPAAIENRALVAAPAMTVENLGDPAWYASVDRYLADNLVVKPPAVEVRATVFFDFLGHSTNPAVVIGRDRWLFLRTEMIRGCIRSAADQLSALDQVQAALAAKGPELRLIIAPDKRTIYPEMVSNVSPPGSTCTDKQRQAMRAGMVLRPWAVDAWGPVTAARNEAATGDPVYFPQDSHWKPEGALPAIKALVESLMPGVWQDADVRAQGTTARILDLPSLLGLNRTEATSNYLVRSGTSVEERTIPIREKLSGSRAILEYVASGTDPLIPGRTIVIFDSFFDLQRELVTPFFASSTWVHEQDIKAHPEIAAELGHFDTIIVERVERDFYREDPAVLTWPFVDPAR